mmetsp:Transcript_23268/g.52473  ORF Transcript_23268/g.52473 Transcript_23268/m.52473 type:complete len:157 (+) Transcript_23268:35-505(+)
MDESEESAGFALAHVCEGHSRAVSSVKYSPCGTTLASASADATVRLWSAKDGEQKGAHSGHSQGLSDMAWSHDSRFLATASDDKTAKLWDVVTVGWREDKAPLLFVCTTIPNELSFSDSHVVGDVGRGFAHPGGPLIVRFQHRFLAPPQHPRHWLF